MSLIEAGSVVGLVLGVVHAIHSYRTFSCSAPYGPTPDRSRGIYFALWTLVLWVLCGTYVLVLWVTGSLFYLAFKASRQWTSG
jgi:hypothetical protein